jgi:hypothetical protein
MPGFRIFHHLAMVATGLRGMPGFRIFHHLAMVATGFFLWVKPKFR